MATRIKASAVRRRIKRRSERASHKKNKNATLRSRKQRARKTARVMRKVMRGGLFGVPFTIKYEATDPDDKSTDKQYIPTSRDWKCLTLNFSKNMFSNSDCYTLKLTFDFNAMLILDTNSNRGYKYLHIPLIINGLFNRIFGYEYGVDVRDNGYISVKDALNSIKFNQYEIDDLASPGGADALNTHDSDELKSGNKFTKDCVIELEFCPFGENTKVQLKNYTTIVKKVFGVKYSDWSTKTPTDQVITVYKKFDEVVKNINELIKDKNKNLYLLLPSVLYSIHSTEPTYMYTSSMSNIDEQFYSFDKAKFEEHKQKALEIYEAAKAKKKAEEQAKRDAYQAQYAKQKKEEMEKLQPTVDVNYNPDS